MALGPVNLTNIWPRWFHAALHWYIVQVSVRKAGLVALCRLLELFPQEPLLCNAWMRSAMPLVRDVESSIQDALLDWAEALLVNKAAAAAGSSAEASMSAAELRPLLAAAAAGGRACSACIGKLCASLHAKKRLKAKDVAKGLESIIAGKPKS